MHAVHIVRDHVLEIRFSLRVQSEFSHPLLNLFFESLNPGLKIYVGDYKLFDYRANGIRNKDWHSYSVNASSNVILDFPHMTNSGGPMQIVRIEAWQGSGGKGTLVIDDFRLTQGDSALVAILSDPITTTPRVTTSPALISSTSTPKSVCDLPKDLGQTCSIGKQKKRFYFDAEARSCLLFEFRGCGGNANNFANYAECSNKCHPAPTTTTSEPTTRVIVTEEKVVDCSVIPPAGHKNCSNGLVPFFYHNTATKTCEEGCSKEEHPGGKFVNHFATRSDCESACIEEGPPPVGFHIKSCLLAPLQGPCRDVSTRYYYRAEKKTCQMFGYGGCAGNSNNFRTKSACDKFCGGAEAKVVLKDDNSTEACYWAKDSGSCKGSLEKFYYDADSKKCKKFVYGGCGGNPNRFPSMDECLDRCFPRRNHAQPLEKAAEEGSKSGLSQAAEVGLGVCLSLLLIAALALGLWYYKVYRDKENYRIFQNQMDRQNSASDLNGNQFDMTAYANPVYDPGRDEVNYPSPAAPEAAAAVRDELVLQPRPGEEINHSEYESTA